MLNLSNVFQLVIHSLNDSPLPEKQFVGYGHQSPFHIAFELRNKLYAIHKEPFEKMLANVPLVSDELSIYKFYKGFIFKRFPVIYITWCYHKVEQFSLLIAYQVKLESKEPAHGALFRPSRRFVSGAVIVMFLAQDSSGLAKMLYFCTQKPMSPSFQ